MRPDGTVVAIRMRQFGDVLATLGALEALKRKHPAGRIVYVVDRAFHGLLSGVPFIDDLVASPPRVGSPVRLAEYIRYVRALRALRPEAVVDFHGNSRSAFLTLLTGAPVRIGWRVRGRRHAYTVAEPRADVVAGRVRPRSSLESALRLLAHLGVDPQPGERVPAAIPVDDAAMKRAGGRLNRAGVPMRAIEDGRVVAINPGRMYPAKAWDPARFVALARELVAQGRVVVVTWGPGELDTAQAIAAGAGEGVVLAPETTLEELPGLLRLCSVLITIDSGLKHLAVAAGIPTVTLFGATDPREWHMGTARDRALWRGLSCSPCRRLTCPFGAPCMDIPVGRVLGEVSAIEGGIS